MTTRKRIASILLVLALMITLGGELFSAFGVRASAEGAVSHSNVLDDLERDESFNPEDYPADANDYSLQVIQVAEGSNGELFVYVYQPSDAVKDLRASKINMSLQEPSDRDLTYSLYNLTWLNSNGVFDKYVVDGFTVSDEAYRYYTIATIYRAYDEEIDTQSEAVDSTQFVGYEVGSVWCVYLYNDILLYEKENLSTVDIQFNATGSVRYDDGFKLYEYNFCDSHYVAFSIENFDIDKIYDADITYTYRKYFFEMRNTTISEGYEESITESKTLYDIDEVMYKGDGLFSKKYTWKRVQDVESFINEAEADANESFSDSELTGLKNSQFVFRFLETDWIYEYDEHYSYHSYYEIENVGILRLHFLSEGKTYNLGVVSDLVGVDTTPELIVDIADNIRNGFEEISSILILGVVLFAIIFLWRDFIKPFLKLVWNGIKYLFNLLIDIITFPFRLIKWLFGK